MKPLSGIRVLDLSRVLAGPYCTALLADLGAEIIKLEPPQGDDYRHIGPFKDGESALFTLNNRGKQSIALDLKDPADLKLAQAMAARVDVVVENFRPGVAERLGLGPKALSAANPRLVYCSISGFGQEGPFRDLPAYDLVVQAMSGLMAGTGEEGGPPLKTGESIADLIAGLFASWSIMAALVQRDRTGQGAVLDVAMYDALFSMLTTSHALHLYAGQLPQRVGNRHPLSTPFGCFATRDGQVVIAVLNARQFATLATLIGTPEAASDPRFASDESRTTHESALKALIENWSRALSTEEAVSALAGAGLPAAPIWDIARAAGNEHALARGLVSSLPHHLLGMAPTIGQPVRFDGEKPVAAHSSPALGGDRAAILRDLGLEEMA
ncbi:CoA transferase [Paracoccus sp. CPCC 101403]|uniref:CoA transferase n=2 Tax=Paracoccus broussonetiae TaxID=3075834 RepID=A0ABU3EAK8_9RHOB|nr:CoA transferase [Paracoccus sp. CPCC 101403]MDT1060500.1 CoA transferase [Paracoccus sp. CPCC 101403]